MKKVIALSLVAILVVTMFAGCALLAKGGSKALVGKWVWEYEGLGEVMSFTFESDGTGSMGAFGEEIEFTYTSDAKNIDMTIEGETESIPYTLDGDTLTLTIEGEEIPLVKK